MKDIWRFIVCQIIIILCKSQPAPWVNINRKIIQEQISFQPCTHKPDSQSKVHLLSNIYPDITSASRITVSGWFLFQARITQEYHMISIHRFDQILASVAFTPSSFHFYSFSQKHDYYPTFTFLNKWNFLIVDVVMDGTQIKVQGLIQSLYQSMSFNEISSNYSNQLLLSELILNSGNPPQSLNVFPSCSLVHSLALQIDSYFDITSLSKLEDYIVKSKSKLILHYDFFYLKNIAGNIINDQGFLQQKILFENSNSFYNTFKIGDQLKISNTSLEGKNELILSFYLKVDSPPSSICSILSSNTLVDINLDLIGNSIQFQSIMVNLSDITQWKHIVIIINQFMKKKIALIVEGFESQFIEKDKSEIPRLFSLKFEPTNCSFQLHHIRIYQGSLFYSSNNCYLQSFDGSCIMCNTGYILDFQNKMVCVEKTLTNTDDEINGVKDWNPKRILCPYNMINDNKDSKKCRCLIGFYQEGNECIKCPKYCPYCSNFNDCGDIRDSNGNCKDFNDFDDGINCLKPQFIMKSRSNYRKVFPLPEQGASCSSIESDLSKFKFTSSQLDIKRGDTIFFSFSVYYKQFTSPTVSSQKIAVIKENSQEIFTIRLEVHQPASGPITTQIQFNLRNQVIKSFEYFRYDTIWIGFWSDNNKHIFMVNTNRVNYHEEINNIQLYATNDIDLCIFRCDTLIDAGCLTLLTNPVTFIKGIYFNTEYGLQQLFTLMAPDQMLVADYKFDKGSLASVVNSANPSPSAVMNFHTPVKNYNSQQGYGLNSQTFANIFIQTPNYWGIITFFCNVEFDRSIKVQDIIFISIVFSDLSMFEVYFEMDYVLDLIRVRVCFLNACRTTKKAILYFDQSNFLFIAGKKYQFKQQQLFEQYIEVEVVCNQVKETFAFNGKVDSYSISMFKLANDLVTPHLIYFDNIKIYGSYGFIYYDYTKEDPCFIYINAENMRCVRLKSNYLFHGNTIVTKEECLKMAVAMNKAHVINQKDQVCEVLQAISYEDTLCLIGEYINGKYVCSICKDQDRDHENKCLVCKSHYYFDTVTSKCQQCSDTCRECITKSNNCTDCKYANQEPPLCNCLAKDEYLNANHECVKCNYKCGSCYDSTSCITCSSEKRKFPDCNCDDQYLEESQQCVQTKCQQKCTICSENSQNCIQCSANRVNPPECLCIEGYQEVEDGTCQPCPDNTYFNSLTLTCQQCSPFCIQCNQEECLNCITGLEKNGKKCQCPQGQSAFQLDDNKVNCIKGMDVVIKVSLQDNQYVIRFVFNEELKSVDSTILNAENIGNLIILYIPEVDPEYYTFINPTIQSNQLQITLKILKNFKANIGYAIIKDNKYFMSKNEKYILKDSYINQMQEFEIGPLLIKKDDLVDPQIDSLNNNLNSLKESNGGLFSIINQLQVLFYLLNTLQPISGFLLLNLQFPPQLYKFYQIIGTFIFPQVVNYQSTDYKTEFTLFGHRLDKEDSQQPTNGNFIKLGFCQSLLVNIPIIVVKYCIITTLLIITYLLQTFQNTRQSIFNKLKVLIVQRINSDNEVSILILIVSIYIQFSSIQQTSFIYRQGFYLALLFIVFQIYLFYFNYKNVMSNNQNEYSKLFTERIDQKSSTIKRSYFLLQLVKKYIYVLVLCIFYNYPLVICIFNGCLFFVSAFSVYLLKPYQNRPSKIIKFLGEFILANIWIMHIMLLTYEKMLFKDVNMDQTTFEKYIQVGKIILIFLVVLNILFLLQILVNLFYAVKKLITKNKVSKRENSVQQKLQTQIDTLNMQKMKKQKLRFKF